MSSQEDKNYVHHYQYTKFQESNTDPFITCNVKRKCLAQTYHASTAIASNDATCYLLEDDLRSYAALVDNKEAGGVNNYAKSILALVSHTKNANACEQWKSGFKSIDTDKFVRLLKPPNCDLADEKGFCRSAEITERDINLLLANRNHKLAGGNEDVRRANPREARPQPNTSQVSAVRREDGLGSNRPNYGWGDPREAQNSKFTLPNPSEARLQSNTLQGSFLHNLEDKGGRRPNNTGWGDSFEAQNSRATVPQRQYNSVQSTTVRGRPNIEQVESRPRFQGPAERTSKQPSNQVYSNGNTSSSMNSGYGEPPSPPRMFTTAREELVVQNAKKWGSRGGSAPSYGNRGNSGNQGYGDPHGYGNQGNGNQGSRGPVKRNLGTRRTVMNKFTPPFRTDNEDQQYDRGGKQGSVDGPPSEEVDERLKNIDPKMIELIRSEIMDTGAPVAWDDIAGLEFAKATIQEIVVWPLLRPDIFTGLRRPPKGILLFGPPGTGKTLIGKCIASQSCSTFFSISASSLTSKWIGDGEKMVRALFAVASCHQPAVVFIDEIDSLLTQRSDTEHESSRRIKTEFLVQLDGATTGEEDRTLVIGATNRPQELDEAARRRLVKRLYIPLPDVKARRQLVERLMSSDRHSLTDVNIEEISQLTDGYSGADMKNLCQEASLGPIRSLGMMQIQHIQPDQVREVNLSDFKAALTRVRASVSPDDLDTYVKWDKTFGSGGAGLA